MSNEQPLVEIRCTQKRYFEDYREMRVCGNKCAEVYPGSGGRAFCWRCRKQGLDPTFMYSVDKNYTPVEKPRRVIKAKPLNGSV